MHVGILGSGSVATTLAGGFLRHGHDVMLGTRVSREALELGVHAGAGGGR